MNEKTVPNSCEMGQEIEATQKVPLGNKGNYENNIYFHYINEIFIRNPSFAFQTTYNRKNYPDNQLYFL